MRAGSNPSEHAAGEVQSLSHISANPRHPVNKQAMRASFRQGGSTANLAGLIVDVLVEKSHELGSASQILRFRRQPQRTSRRQLPDRARCKNAGRNPIDNDQPSALISRVAAKNIRRQTPLFGLMPPMTDFGIYRNHPRGELSRERAEQYPLPGEGYVSGL